MATVADLRQWKSRLQIIETRIGQVISQLINTPPAQRVNSHLVGVVVMAMDSWLSGYVVHRQQMAGYVASTRDERELLAWFKSKETFIGLVGKALDTLVPGWRTKHSGSASAKVPPVSPPTVVPSTAPAGTAPAPAPRPSSPPSGILIQADDGASIKDGLVAPGPTLSQGIVQPPRDTELVEKKEEEKGNVWMWWLAYGAVAWFVYNMFFDKKQKQIRTR